MAFHWSLRNIYLYVVAIIGLVLIIIGSVSLLNLGLRTYIFSKADYPCDYARPLIEKTPDGTSLTPAEQEAQRKDNERICLEQRSSEKQRSAANAIAMLLVGIPLYSYHWSVVRKES
jgi:hypothetical protein